MKKYTEEELKNMSRARVFTKGNGSPFIAEKQDRNAKCKCGSGQKAKHCCGVKTKYYNSKKDTI